MENLCGSCKKKPVRLKKWGLCKTCYSKQRLNGSITTTPRGLTCATVNHSMNKAECIFASRHLAQGWIFHPMTLRLLDGTSYSPDFWDPSRKAFLELSDTKQAYYVNRTKYDAVRSTFPTLPFVCVDANNKEIPHPGWVSEMEKRQAARNS